MSDAPTYRCPECDTYSGSFTSSSLPDGTIEVAHSICGRSGTPASFDRDSAEYAAVYDHQEDDDDEGGTTVAVTGVVRDEGTIVVLTGLDEDGCTVVFAADHRMAQDILDALSEEPVVQVPDWAFLRVIR